MKSCYQWFSVCVASNHVMINEQRLEKYKETNNRVYFERCHRNCLCGFQEKHEETQEQSMFRKIFEI